MSLPLMGAGPSAPGGVEFDPSTITGLLAWYKADSLVLNNNDPVASWADSSGTGNIATQGTGAAQPTYKTNQINGKAAVSFDDGDHLASALSMATKPLTVFAVVNFTNFSVPRTVLGQATTGGFSTGRIVP